MYRSSPLRATLGLDMCKVCTEAVHWVALWTRVTLGLDMCKVCTEADRFEQNPAAGQIFRNRPAGQMFRNRPAGQIFRNRPAGQILRNRPAGQITPNRPAGQITPNRPAGQITLNRPAGQTGWLAGIKIVNEIRVQCGNDGKICRKKTWCCGAPQNPPPEKITSKMSISW